VKELTRGKALTEDSLKSFINTLDLPKTVKNQLLNLKPSDYIGYALELAMASN
jgi:adenylosuccinate lyase